MVSEGESAKDTLQVVAESAADHVGKIATIITAAVRDIARELGDWMNEVVEMRDTSRRSSEDDD
jgi:hypothetical protein